ncbi:MAG: RNA polymerase sigma factor [Bacteroidota bacterium]|nr:RNA polymerase sigma factor [Bacteroidota bacterium]MDP4231699.1 RNA polymerase sigma factor [Bacteroidota bacterium]MDP4237203.1 RNA polymerase sigma factor [Bacteroidota bacterium]
MTSRKQEEFLLLLEPVHTRLWRFVLSVTRDHCEAEDLLSETVLASYERFESLKDKQAFTSFLFTIATRIHYHQKRRKNWFGAYNAEYADSLESSEIAPDSAADIRIVRDALSELSPRQRETVVLFEISGFSLEEIREIQGGTLSGVKSRLVRGRKELSKLLGVPTEPVKTDEKNGFFLRTRGGGLEAPFAVVSHE